MAFPRLANDNIVELLETDDRIGRVRPAKDDAEFFNLLREKVLDDFKRMLETKDIDKKINALADLRGDIDEYVNFLRNGKFFIDGIMKERQEKMGGFERKLILEGVDKKIPRRWTEEDYEMVKKAGEEEGYPVVNLKRNNENKVYTQLVSGKEAWEKHMKLRLNNAESAQDDFLDFVEAVHGKDYERETQK